MTTLDQLFEATGVQPASPSKYTPEADAELDKLKSELASIKEEVGTVEEIEQKIKIHFRNYFKDGSGNKGHGENSQFDDDFFTALSFVLENGPTGVYYEIAKTLAPFLAKEISEHPDDYWKDPGRFVYDFQGLGLGEFDGKEVSPEDRAGREAYEKWKLEQVYDPRTGSPWSLAQKRKAEAARWEADRKAYRAVHPLAGDKIVGDLSALGVVQTLTDDQQQYVDNYFYEKDLADYNAYIWRQQFRDSIDAKVTEELIRNNTGPGTWQVTDAPVSLADAFSGGRPRRPRNPVREPGSAKVPDAPTTMAGFGPRYYTVDPFETPEGQADYLRRKREFEQLAGPAASGPALQNGTASPITYTQLAQKQAIQQAMLAGMRGPTVPTPQESGASGGIYGVGGFNGKPPRTPGGFNGPKRSPAFTNTPGNTPLGVCRPYSDFM